MTSQTMSSIKTLLFPFVLWTATSFLCHKLAKEFLMSAVPGVTSSHDMTSFERCSLALMLTLGQSIVCLMTVSPGSQPGSAVTMTSHFLATLATNLSLAFIHAASTFAIKLTEPVTMVIAHRLVFKTSISVETFFSLPLIIVGAFIFTDATLDETTTMGVALAMASNVILAARNVSMKLMQQQSSPAGSEDSSRKPVKVINLRDTKVIFIAYSALSCCMLTYLILWSTGTIQDSTLSPYTVMALVGSALFHVAYSYISTNVVLRVMTVVSHSVANIFKRLLVVVLLYASGHRTAKMSSWAGLCLSVFGLAVYVYPQLKQAANTNRLNTSNIPQGSSDSRVLKKISYFVACLILCLGTVTTVTKVGKMAESLNGLQFQMNSLRSLVSGFEPTSRYDSSGIFRQEWGVFSEDLEKEDMRTLEAEENKNFLTKRLVDYPNETDFLSKQLRDIRSIVAENQRIHQTVLQDLIGHARHVMLFEIATYENKGDPAITAGETMLLRRLNLTVVYYCSTFSCSDKAMENAKQIAKKYEKSDLVVLMQGGGNLLGYHYNDHVRERVINAFPDYLKILFSQSIKLPGAAQTDLKHCQQIYSNRTNFVMYLRDRQSLGIAQEYFKGIKHMLMPDMAWNIGMVPRQLPPAFDVLWLKRGDGESPKYNPTELVKTVNFTCHINDYVGNWPSHHGVVDMETSFLIASEGFQFLQRGRVLITDRLHGHILSSLMNIPHVLFDNPPMYKLSSFHKSWTASLDNVVIVDNKEDALIQAERLLRRYDAFLPKVGPFMSKDIMQEK